VLPVNGASKAIPPAGAGCARGAPSAAVGSRGGDIGSSREAGWPSGSVVTWRRAQMVLGSAQGMDIAQIARVTFASPDRVRDVLHIFNLDGFDSRYPRYRGGRPPTFTLAQRRAIKQLALSHHETMACRSRPGRWRSWPSSWSPRGWSTTSATRAYGVLLREQGVSFQRLKTWKQSGDPGLRGHVVKVFQRHRLCVVEAVVGAVSYGLSAHVLHPGVAGAEDGGVKQSSPTGVIPSVGARVDRRPRRPGGS
jgi:transposase